LKGLELIQIGAVMLDKWNFSSTEITTWVAISISIFALYYSRKAIRLQVVLKRNEQVSSINIFIPKSPFVPGLILWNPEAVPLIEVKGTYYHRWFGSHGVKIDYREIVGTHKHKFPLLQQKAAMLRASLPKNPSTVPTYNFSVESATEHRESSANKVKRFLEHALYRAIFGPSWYIRIYFKRHGYQRPKKRKRGQVVIAEVIVTDAGREQWYLNTSGTKLHIPKRGVRRWLFFLVYRARLIGYPFWSDFYWTTWGSIAVGSVDLILIVDAYFNDGEILTKVFLALGWI
jgi:hypothetical protein